jgi:hypothetical protein
MCGMRQSAASTAPIANARSRCRGQGPKPRSGAPKAQALTAAIAIAAQSSVPSIVRHTRNSIGANAPIGSSPTLRIYTSLTDVTPPSELVVATALRQRLPEFLLNSTRSNIFAIFIAGRQDTNKMQAFRLAA